MKLNRRKQNKIEQNKKCSESKLWGSAPSHCWHVRVSLNAESAVKFRSYSNSNGVLHAPLPYSSAKVQPSQNHPPALPREPGCAHGCVQGLANCSHNRPRGVAETVWMDTMSQQHTCQSWGTATVPAMLTGNADSLWVSWEEEAVAKSCFISNAKEVSAVSLLSFPVVAATYWWK